MKSLDLKILASHPVQYQAPLFRNIQKTGMNLKVGYVHPGSALRSTSDIDFNLEFKWDIDLLDGYPSFFFNQASQHLTLLQRIRSARYILSWALEEKDIPLLLLGWFSEIVFLVWYARIITRSPVLVAGDNTLGSFYYTKKANWKINLLKLLLRQTDGVMYFGQKNKQFFLDMGVKSEKLFFMPHSVDNNRFFREWKRFLPDRTSYCLEHGLDPSKPTFLFCGKLIQKKRPVLLLDAFLSAGLQDIAQLIYVGEGTLRTELEKRITDSNLRNVHLLGFFNQTKMPMAYVLGEILCLISDPTETWGLVVNEAQSCCRPVIVSDVIGCVSDLVDSSNGWIVPNNDFETLADTLAVAMYKNSDWSNMGVEGNQKVFNHSYQKMIEGIYNSLDSLYTN
jgi:glycosyltransferase involved in cell wall biosynthesis